VRNSTTIQSRQLGRHLRELRKQAALSADDAGAEIGLSAATIYRIEAGTSIPRPGDTMALCDSYGADAGTRTALVALTREAMAPGWWRSLNGAIPKWFDTYVGYETAAAHIRAYDAEVVIGLFQTRAYADATYRVARPEPSEAEREQRVSVRMQRQRILGRRNPPRIDVVLGEAALARPFGDDEVMAGQLGRLDEVSRLPHVTLRILPLDRAHAALSAGARFNLLTFPAAGRGRATEPPIVYTESLCGALYLDKPPEIRAYDEVWAAIGAVALPPAESRKKITEHLERWRR
jgi:DNA-binding XRE family transcriptional regulator